MLSTQPVSTRKSQRVIKDLTPKETFSFNLPQAEAEKKAVQQALEKKLSSFAYHYKGGSKSTSLVKVICIQKAKISPSHNQVVKIIKNTTYAVMRSEKTL